jgi:predicted esterase
MKIGRNQPCPCGSGKKYKRCHLGRPLPLEAAAETPPDIPDHGTTAGYVQFVPSDPPDLNPDGISASNPSEAALVIFLHGSEAEHEDDVCIPSGTWCTTPRVISSLAGKVIENRRILVVAHCSAVKPIKKPQLRGDETKIMRRWVELGSVLDRFSAAGYDPKATFLAGHSAGAWLALWLTAIHPGRLGGVIAFAPAFAGQRGRTQSWANARSTSVQDFVQSTGLPSLVYAFEEDEWEPPSDLEFLGRIPGLELIKFRGEKTKMLETSDEFYHCGAYSPSFEKEQERIVQFMATRLRAASSPQDAG